MFKFNFDVCDENISSKEKVDSDPESSNEKSRKCKNKTRHESKTCHHHRKNK